MVRLNNVFYSSLLLSLLMIDPLGVEAFSSIASQRSSRITTRRSTTTQRTKSSKDCFGTYSTDNDFNNNWSTQRNGFGSATMMHASKNKEIVLNSENKVNHHQITNNNNKKWPTRLLRAAISIVGGSLALVAMFPQASVATVSLMSTSGGAALASTVNLVDSLSQTGFYQAFSLVFLSEIGDKTFFIAGLLAMKTSKLVSYLGSMGALVAMTILSVLIGQIFHAVPTGLLGDAGTLPLDDIAAVLAFAFFGFKTLKEAFDMDGDGSVMDEELAEAQETVQGSSTIREVKAWAQIASTFGLVFAAEFGDRSFLSTIALSAAQNPLSVAGGAIAAHGIATGIAVSGGSLVAKYISEKVIGYIGGTLFLVFAITTALGIF